MSFIIFILTDSFAKSLYQQKHISFTCTLNQSFPYIIARAYYYDDGLYLNKKLTCDVVNSISVTEGWALRSYDWSIFTFLRSDWM